jgi:hypothetical protein
MLLLLLLPLLLTRIHPHPRALQPLLQCMLLLLHEVLLHKQLLLHCRHRLLLHHALLLHSTRLLAGCPHATCALQHTHAAGTSATVEANTQHTCPNV